jgi:hypothetical protein
LFRQSIRLSRLVGRSGAQTTAFALPESAPRVDYRAGRSGLLALRSLVAWLSFGVLLGPNVCCCALARALSAVSQAESPVSLPSCCSSKKSSVHPFKIRPASKGECPEGECPCKKGGSKDVVPQPGLSQVETTVQWLSKADLHALRVHEPSDPFGAADLVDAACSIVRNRDARALARSSILRC